MIARERAQRVQDNDRRDRDRREPEQGQVVELGLQHLHEQQSDGGVEQHLEDPVGEGACQRERVGDEGEILPEHLDPSGHAVAVDRELFDRGQVVDPRLGRARLPVHELVLREQHRGRGLLEGRDRSRGVDDHEGSAGLGVREGIGDRLIDGNLALHDRYLRHLLDVFRGLQPDLCRHVGVDLDHDRQPGDGQQEQKVKKARAFPVRAHVPVKVP